MSTLGSALDGALAPGTVRARHEGREAEVDVVEVDRLGATIRGVRVRVPDPAPVREQAARLPEALRPLPDRVVPVEVDPRLGGAVLRSDPRDVVDGGYFEVCTAGGDATIGRRPQGAGRREPLPFTLTREQLRRLVDGVGDALAPATPDED